MAQPIKENTYVEIDSQTMGIVFNTCGETVTALFDKEDYPRIKNFKWNISTISKRNKTRYIKSRPWRSGPSKDWVVLFHQLVLSFPISGEVDHINRVGFDNRKKNLRVVSKLENARNKVYSRKAKSGFFGVREVKNCPNNPWLCEIRHLRKIIRLGFFSTKEEAAKAYDKKVKELRGDFAILNFP